MAVDTLDEDHGHGRRGTGSRLLRALADAWRTLVVGVPYIWLLLFFLVPFLIILKISFAVSIIARPPYTPLWDWGPDGALTISLSFLN